MSFIGDVSLIPSATEILSLYLTFGILIMMCLGVGLFASLIIGTLCASWTCMSIFFTKLGKFSFIIFSNRSPISCSFSFPSGTPMIWMLYHLTLPQTLLILSLIIGFFFLLVVLCGCFLLRYLANHWFDYWLHPLYCCFPVSCFVFQLCIFHFWLDLFMLLRFSLNSLSILITSVLNSASDKLLISTLFSYFSAVFICSFIWAVFLCFFILAASLCLFLSIW